MPTYVYSTNENYTLINPLDRSKDGYYHINGNITHVFPFQIPPVTPCFVTAYQTGQGNQDFSMKMWFSQVPLDQTMFTEFDSLNPAFLINLVKEVFFVDQQYVSNTRGLLPLDPNTIYYCNVRNMAAKSNSYRLQFPRLLLT